MTPEKRALLCKLIHDLLSRSASGLTTIGVRNAVAAVEDEQQRKARFSRQSLSNSLGFDVSVSVVLDALEGMQQRGAVTRDDEARETLWRAVRRNDSSNRQVSG